MKKNNKINDALLCLLVSSLSIFMPDSAIGEEPKDRQIGGKNCSDCVLNMSHHDKYNIDRSFKDDGIMIVIHKATQGQSIDGKYALKSPQAFKAGLGWGAYHFASYEGFDNESNGFRNDPIKQARVFVATMLKYRQPNQKYVLPVFDLEAYTLNGKDGVHMSLHGACASIEEIHRLTGVWPGFYTGSYFTKEKLNGKVLAKLYDPQNATQIKRTLSNCWLWIAQYDNHPENPQLPQGAPWKEWTMWQYTTNINELKDLKIVPSPLHRHFVGKTSGELNYLAANRKDVDQWIIEHSWGFELKAPLDNNKTTNKVE